MRDQDDFADTFASAVKRVGDAALLADEFSVSRHEAPLRAFTFDHMPQHVRDCYAFIVEMMVLVAQELNKPKVKRETIASHLESLIEFANLLKHIANDEMGVINAYGYPSPYLIKMKRIRASIAIQDYVKARTQLRNAIKKDPEHTGDFRLLVFLLDQFMSSKIYGHQVSLLAIIAFGALSSRFENLLSKPIAA